MPNQAPPGLGAKILEITEQDLTCNYIRIRQQLNRRSPSAARCLWQRQSLVVRYQRLLWLERKTS